MKACDWGLHYDGELCRGTMVGDYITGGILWGLCGRLSNGGYDGDYMMGTMLEAI
jgi:hypothetical protein